MMDHTLNTPAVYNSALAFTSGLHRASGRPGKRNEALFGSSLGITQPCLYVWPSRFPEIDQSFSKPPLTSHSPFCPFTFFGAPLYAPSGIATSGSCDVKQLPVIVFDKCPRDRAACTE